MKKVIITILLLLTAVNGWAQKVWTNPSYRNEPQGFQFDVNEVEFRNDETVLHITVRNHPGAKFSFGSCTVLKTEDMSYPIVSAKKTRDGETDLALDTHIPIPESGKTDVALHFQPLPQDVKQFDLIEGYARNFFKIWDITDPAYKSQALLFNSNWRDAETGDWIISLFNDNAVYANKVWQYDKKTEKKVVLASGNEKLSIAIGKEKDGKRIFNIGGKKQMLSAITTNTITDYPTTDNTSFNTELKEGKAVVSGWLRYPKELLLKDKLTVEIGCSNVATDDDTHVSTQVDSLGRFELGVPLVGTQGATLLIQNGQDDVVDGVALILTPGENYFILKDYKSSQTLFMGNDARLQNEIQIEIPRMQYAGFIDNPVSDDSVRVMAQKWIHNYEQSVAQNEDFMAQHPNLSKRFRDFIRESQRIYVCDQILMMHYNTYSRLLPADIMQWVEDHSAVDTSLPVNLCRMSSMLRYKRECYAYADPRINVLWGRPTILPWLEEKGMLHLNDKEHQAISQMEKMNREIFTLYSEIKDRKTLNDSIAAVQEKYMEAVSVVSTIHGSEDYQKALNILCVGGEQGITNAIIDSLCTDPMTNSIHHAQILNEYIDHERCALPENLEPYIALIKEPYFRKVIADKNEYFKRLMRGKEAAVNAVIHPSSDVEGLTDGKTIIDKIIEPYRGKIVYLDIWGTWCAPCKRKLSESHKLKAELKDYDIVYLYLANRSPEKSWKNVIAEYDLTAPNCVHYNLPDNQQHAVEQYVGLTGYPTLDDENLSEFKKKLDAMEE